MVYFDKSSFAVNIKTLTILKTFLLDVKIQEVK